MPTYKLQVNQEGKKVETEGDTPLLYVLRNDLELDGPKFGCGEGQCGSCMVLIDGQARMSCLIPVSEIGNAKITTLEGLADGDGNLHPLQQSILNHQAVQCGYCMNGVIISAISLLDKNPNPTREEINRALHVNLCRCGAHTRIIKAIQSVQNL